MKGEVTKKELATLKFIAKFIDKKGYSPSRRDIAEHFGNQVNDVQQRLARMRQKGLLDYTDGIARSIVLLESN